MKRTLLGIAFLILMAVPVWAAPVATVVSGSGAGTIGKAGAFRPAAAGATIGDDEFLLLPAGAKATVKLADGTTTEFTGKVAVPGRRLTTAKEAGALVKLGQAIQGAAESVVGVDSVATVPGSGKASDVADKLGTKGGAQAYMSDDDDDDDDHGRASAPPATTEAFLAEDLLQKGKTAEARTKAKAILVDAKAAPLEHRRAAAVLALIAAGEYDAGNALAYFSRAVLPLTAETPAAKAFRIAALVQRADFHRQVGDLANAKTDLLAASGAYAPPDDTRPFAWHRANFLLGALALDEGKRSEADRYFALVGTPGPNDKGAQFDRLRELRAGADRLLAAPEPKKP